MDHLSLVQGKVGDYCSVCGLTGFDNNATAIIFGFYALLVRDKSNGYKVNLECLTGFLSTEEPLRANCACQGVYTCISRWNGGLLSLGCEPSAWVRSLSWSTHVYFERVCSNILLCSLYLDRSDQ